MKIGIITSPFGPLPPNALGAVERRWYYMAKEFNKQGNNVVFYSKQDSTYSNEKEVDITSIKGYSRTSSIYFDIILDFVFTLKAYFKMEKCDVLIQNTFWAPILGRLFKRKYKRAVYNVARKPAKHFKLYKVDQFTCVSKAVQDDLNNYISEPKKGVTVNNPVNLDYFSFKTRTIPEDGETIIVGYHGRVHPEKGLDILCRSLELLSPKYRFKLLIIGPYDIERGGGGDNYVEYLKSLCPNIEISFTGPFSSPESLNVLLHQCQIYCYPSVASGETFGVSPLEAMATGAPVIVSGLRCFNDFIKNGETGFVFDHTAKKPETELSEIIEKLIHSSNTVESIGTAAHNESEKFSIERIASQYLYNFNKLLTDLNGK